MTLDVPGPRESQLKITFRIPGFKLARHVAGAVSVANVGQSAVRFWGENDTTSWPGGAATKQQRFDKSLVPIGGSTSLKVDARPAWPIGFVTLRGQVIYPSTVASSTTALPFKKRVLVVDPKLLVVLVAVLAIGMIVLLARRRRSRHT